MAYYFTGGSLGVGAQFIDYGTGNALFPMLQTGDMSIGMWVRRLPRVAGLINGDLVAEVAAGTTFRPTAANISASGLIWGMSCFHDTGGGGSSGVDCRPGLINPLYDWPLNQWMYFGFSRSVAARTYSSYFGSASALVDGPSVGYLGGPFPATGAHFLAGLSFGVGLGPFSYWSTTLSRDQHLALARCNLPIGVDIAAHLLVRSKMTLGAVDISPHTWPNTFHNDPQFVADSACSGQSQGLDYSFYVA